MKQFENEFKSARGYKVISVEQVEPSESMPGVWCRYVVQSGESKIEGLHIGGIEEVTEHATNFVLTLNERFLNNVYIYGSTWKKAIRPNAAKQS